MTSIQKETTVSYALVGWIIEASGKVLLKRSGWGDYRPTFIGAELYPGDLLKPASAAKVLVQCANGKTIWPVPAGVISGATNGCPPQAIPVSRRPGDLIPPRGVTNPLIPFIISPRCTSILNPLPTLRWNGVPGVKTYTVSIMSEDNAIWETKVKETEVLYSGKPRLEKGVDYLLSIVADTGASSQEEDLPCLGFCLLDENEATLVRDSDLQLLNLELTDEAKTLARVHLYMRYQLRAEAIEMLARLVKKGSKLAAIHRTLGNLYEEVGLNRLAETCYLKATQLAADVEDIEGQAWAAACLGDVYDAIANQPEAIRWLSQAQDGYERLGDTQRASELAQRLSQFK